MVSNFNIKENKINIDMILFKVSFTLRVERNILVVVHSQTKNPCHGWKFEIQLKTQVLAIMIGRYWDEM
ncbi:hypothetical protein Avbf_03985 [Armadillidium vulgare]|nr:hypothetical protein Avbf_03985 [Armadillidium vulgare]